MQISYEQENKIPSIKQNVTTTQIRCVFCVSSHWTYERM